MVKKSIKLRNVHTFLILQSCFIAVLVGGPSAGVAQVKDGEIKLVHVAPELKSFPAPGTPLKLTVRAVNTRRTTDAMILIGTKDGEYVEIPSVKSYLNERDVATYEFEFPAPLAELKYRFVLYPNASEQPVASQQEVIRRSCLPQLTEAVIPGDLSRDGNEQMKQLLVASRSLEQRVNVLENCVKTAEKLQALIGAKE